MRQAALALPDPAHEMLGLDPHLKETLRLQHELRDSLEEIRHRACHEVTLILEHAREDTTAWFQCSQTSHPTAVRHTTDMHSSGGHAQTSGHLPVGRPDTAERAVRRLPTPGKSQPRLGLAQTNR